MIEPGQAKRVDVADVFKGDVRAGHLKRTPEGIAFGYDPGYLDGGGPAVASTLPPREQPYMTGRGAVPAFFAGLLPEGARLLAVIAAVKTSPDDEMSLLVAVGSDSVGDVSVVPIGERPRDLGESSNVRDPSEVVFRELFARSVDPSTGALDRAIPGVQDKLSDAVISFPVRRGQGPSILKLTPDRFPKLVENEAFFLGMAEECGFRVPPFQVIEDRDGEKGLLIERFDRSVKGDRIDRIAQEDTCQLAGKWPAEKYRLSMREVIETVNGVVSAPRVASLHLVLLTAFSYLIANGDMHAKNMSVRWLPEELTVEPTPVYDLVTTRPYPLDTRLALHVDGRDIRIRGRDLVRFAERFEIPERPVRRKLTELCDRAQPFIERVDEIGLEDRQTEQVRREMESRIAELRG